MVIKLFKIFTCLALVVALIVIIETRDFVIPNKETLATKQSQTNQISTGSDTFPLETESVQNLPPLLQQSDGTPKVSSSTSRDTSLVASKASQIANTPNTAPIQQVTQYITMEDGHTDYDESYRPVSPCKVTMGYRIGTFSTRFGISKSDFITNIEDAAALWGNAVNKTLFKYDENGPLTINLIYDERQARTEEINNLALEIANSKDSADSIKATFEEEKAIYQNDAEQLTQDRESFKSRYDAYTAKVTMYNAQGGAPQNEYDKMTQELSYLKEEAEKLEARRLALIAYSETINKKVEKYNELAAYINTLITRSNALGGKKFTEGRFSPSNNTIDIFQYSDPIKLQRVITHELGHALGLGHNNNANSIMYSINRSTSTGLSKEDLNALYTICGTN